MANLISHPEKKNIRNTEADELEAPALLHGMHKVLADFFHDANMYTIGENCLSNSNLKNSQTPELQLMGAIGELFSLYQWSEKLLGASKQRGENMPVMSYIGQELKKKNASQISGSDEHLYTNEERTRAFEAEDLIKHQVMQTIVALAKLHNITATDDGQRAYAYLDADINRQTATLLEGLPVPLLGTESTPESMNVAAKKFNSDVQAAFNEIQKLASVEISEEIKEQLTNDKSLTIPASLDELRAKCFKLIVPKGKVVTNDSKLEGLFCLSAGGMPR